MATKRKNGDDDATSRDKKKVKVTAARTIAVQSTSRTPASGSSTPGPSGALTSLPATIDVEKFVDARAYEIQAMQTAMKNAPASATHRVWQTLPRHLRRRAASHDVRRVPLRLRDKAKAEMDLPVKKKSFKISKRGKEKKVNRTDDFRKRQVDKAWLETHVWHAKRMHMENMWGYRLAVTPTDKSYRPSYRASVRSSILHDASYFSMIELRGPESMLVRMLESCCDPQGPGPGSKRCLTGARALDTHIYGYETYPFNFLAPMTIIWRPLLDQKDSTQNPPPTQPRTHAGHGNAQVSYTPRTLWLRFHPSVHTEVFDVLKTSASAAAEHFKTRPGFPAGSSIDIVDLKGQINAFEIMGPKATQVIRSALKPVPSNDKAGFKQFWLSLKDIGTSGSLPRGMVVGFKVEDPRLSFPPKNVQQDELRAVNPTITFSSPTLAASEIWEPENRDKLAKPRYKKRDLDARRSKNDVPGIRLNPLRQDDRIPVIMIQRSLGNTSSMNEADGEAIHGWILLIPAGWSMAFFESLVHTGTRVAGQRERQTQAYETGTPYFPRDYPSTDTYRAFAEERERQERDTWERKPPAKRVNYESLGSVNPWKPDWEGLLGLTKPGESGTTAFSTAQRDAEDDSSPGSSSSSQVQVVPWLLRGCDIPDIISALPSSSAPPAPSLTPIPSTTSATATTLYLRLNQYRAKRQYASGPLNFGAVGAPSVASLLKGALVNVSLKMCARGTPEDLAMIYTVPDDVVIKWEKLHKRLKKRRDKAKGKAKMTTEEYESLYMDFEEDSPEEMELANSTFPRDSIIGYVTTGHFSLSRGQGFAIGAVSLTQLVHLREQRSRLHGDQGQGDIRQTKYFVVVRNANSSLYRAAYLRLYSEEP